MKDSRGINTKMIVLAVAVCISGLLTEPAQAQNEEFVSEAVSKAITQAKTAHEAIEWGVRQSGNCLYGGFVEEREEYEDAKDLAINMDLLPGRAYLFVGAGDDDIIDLDISVTSKSGIDESDIDTDATPWVFVEAKKKTRVRVALELEQSKEDQDCFAIMIILQSDGDPGSLKELERSAQGLVSSVVAARKQKEKSSQGKKSVDFDDEPGQVSLLAGLLKEGKKSGLIRRFTPQDSFSIVGWCDSNAKDMDISITTLNGKTVAKDNETDRTPVVKLKESNESRKLRINIEMFDAKKSAFGIAAVLVDYEDE